MSINNDSSKEIESSLETEKTFFFGPERLPQAYKQQEEQTTKAKVFRFLQYLNKVYGRYDSIEDFQRKGRVAKSKTFLQNVKEVAIDIFNNLKAGITVALVSIPLSISLALASDASPIRGLITAAWAGLVGSLLGGSRFSIHGPTGAVSGLLFSYSLQWGKDEPDIHCILTIWAGIIIILMFLFNLHKYFLIIPSSVILGWTVGVALIIGLNQLRFVFGIPGTVDMERYPEFYMNVAEVLRKIGHINYYAVVIFIVFLVALAILVNILPKLPWNIVAAVAGILMGAAIQLDWIPNLQTGLETISIRYGKMDAGLLFAIPKVSSFYNFFKPEYIVASISLAFTVTLETLVSCKVTDEKIAKRMPREVMGLGVANVVSGAMGGIVCAAALARTVLNMKSGASSRLAGITCAVGVYLVSVVFFRYFQFLLLPVTGSILVLVAIRMVKYEEIINLYKFDRKMFILMIVSCIVTIFRSPTEVIIYGTCIGLILHGVDVGPGHTEIQIRKGREIVSLEHSILIDERLESEEEMVELYLKQIEAQKVIEAQKAKQGKAHSGEVAISITPAPREVELETPSENLREGEPENEESDTNETSMPTGLTQSVSMLDIQQKLEMSTGIHTPWGPVSYNTTMIYHLSGELSYINADNHLLRCRRLAKRPDHKFVIFACRHLYYIDVDGLYAFEKMVQAFSSAKRQVFLSGIHEDSRNIVCSQLFKMKWFNDMKTNGQVFYNESDAVEATVKAL